MKKKVEIYTDGACSGNPGIGGWGVVMLYKGHKKEASGAEQSTTNNRMELTAIIQGLKMLKEPCIVTVYSDSAYSVEPFLKGWINGWIMKGWRTSNKDEVKNVDLWKELLSLMQIHEVSYVKVKGHADNELNNRCDALARGAIKELQKTLPAQLPPFPTEFKAKAENTHTEVIAYEKIQQKTLVFLDPHWNFGNSDADFGVSALRR